MSFKSGGSSFLKALLVPILLTAALPASAEWMLKSNQSSLHYVTSKAAAITEVNTFSELRGSITDDGKASLIISLASVDTQIDIRNQRMRDLVFKVAEFTTAEVILDVSSLNLDAMSVGESFKYSAEASVNLNGGIERVNAELRVTALSEGTVEVENIRPLVINVANFGYADAVEELREIAGLPSINPNIVVDFSLIYSLY